MSAGKLSRVAGSVFVLAAIVGGIGASTPGAGHGTGGSGIVTEVKAGEAAGPTEAPATTLSDVIWE